VPEAHASDTTVNEVARQAERALQGWRRQPVRRRSGYLRQLRHVIVEQQDRIAAAVAKDTGKPVTEVINQEVTAALGMLRFAEQSYPRWLRPHRSRYWQPGFWTKAVAIHFQPIGVLAVIAPGNFPFSLAVMQTGLALLCGNCVIIKPSENCPRTAAVIRDLFEAAAFPTGVVAVVEGAAQTARSLIAHDVVRKVLFTGSLPTGKDVAELCGRSFKPCALELGGNGAAIVCEDADLDLAARGIAWSAFYATGLSCIGTKRVFVHAGIHDAFLERLLAEMRGLKGGDPLDPCTDLGQVNSEATRSRVRELVDDALAGGAVALTAAGAAVDASEALDRSPIVLVNVSPSMDVMSPARSQHSSSADVGGPIVAVRKIGSSRQAVNETNACAFGLSASVWGRRRSRLQDIARMLDVGMVWINDASVGQPQFPWGGFKQSGWGRLFAREALPELTTTKVVSHDRRRSSRSKLWWFPYSREKHDVFVAANRVAFGRNRIRALGRLIAALWRLGRGASS